MRKPPRFNNGHKKTRPRFARLDPKDLTEHAMKVKSIGSLVVAMSLCQACYANDYGMGVSLNGDENAVYLPINVSPSWRVEPYALYARRSSDNSRALVGSSTTVDLGVGIFKCWRIATQVQVYGGASVAYHWFHISGYDSTGYGIAPTLGAEYFLVEKVSVAAQASVNAWRLRNEYEDNSLDSTDKSLDTLTQVILRFMF